MSALEGFGMLEATACQLPESALWCSGSALIKPLGGFCVTQTGKNLASVRQV